MLEVKRSGHAYFFKWRNLRVHVADRSIQFEGPSIEAFVDRVIFPILESLDPDRVTLHGAAVASKKTVILLGKSGVGKSTTVEKLAGG